MTDREGTAPMRVAAERGGWVPMYHVFYWLSVATLVVWTVYSAYSALNFM
jgi:hypothetical protein